MIRNRQKKQYMGFSFRLKCYLSTNHFSSDENHLQIQDKSIQCSKDENIFSEKSFQSCESSSIDYTKIYEQNKRRLKEVQGNSGLKQFFFDQNYIKSQLIDTRYFYSDILVISKHVIQYLTVHINSQVQIPILNPLISLKHIHFLLKVYHMYIKQFKVLKQQTYSIIEYFFDNSLILQNFRIQNSLEPFIYLKKCIDSQILLGNANKIVKLAQKYSIFLEKAYKHEAMNLSKQINPDLSNNIKFSAKIVKKSKLLENYLLSFPNFWIQKQSADTSNQGQNLSGPVLKTYDYFVTQFSNLFKQIVDYWLNFESQIKLPNPMPVNFSSRNFLLQQFKQEELNKCLNCLKLVIHRLWSILEIPKPINQRSQELAIKKHDPKNNRQSFMTLAKNYEEGNLNILKYLPSGKIAHGGQLKFMRLLIIMKKLFGYHTLSRVKEKDMTHYLEKLFEYNWNDIIVTKNEDNKRQINILIGQLISRLVSGSWTDEQDVLGKYFQNNLVKNRQNKVMRENQEEFLN